MKGARRKSRAKRVKYSEHPRRVGWGRIAGQREKLRKNVEQENTLERIRQHQKRRQRRRESENRWKNGDQQYWRKPRRMDEMEPKRRTQQLHELNLDNDNKKHFHHHHLRRLRSRRGSRADRHERSNAPWYSTLERGDGYDDKDSFNRCLEKEKNSELYHGNGPKREEYGRMYGWREIYGQKTTKYPCIVLYLYLSIPCMFVSYICLYLPLFILISLSFTINVHFLFCSILVLKEC